MESKTNISTGYTVALVVYLHKDISKSLSLPESILFFFRGINSFELLSLFNMRDSVGSIVNLVPKLICHETLLSCLNTLMLSYKSCTCTYIYVSTSTIFSSASKDSKELLANWFIWLGQANYRLQFTGTGIKVHYKVHVLHMQYSVQPRMLRWWWYAVINSSSQKDRVSNY